jgi:hypothetical protein
VFGRQALSSVRTVAVAASAAILCVASFLLAQGSAGARTQDVGVTPPVIDIMASDYAFDAPDTLPAGLVTIRLMNHGREPHHAQVLRLNDGVSFDDFAAALQAEGDRALRLTTLTGGPGALSTLKTTEVTLDLTPGSYALACFISGPDGVPHLAKGMLKPLTVTPTGAQQASAPEVSGTMLLRDFSFDLPDTVPAGTVSYRVVNAGPQPHELNLLKLAPGASASEVLAWQPDQGTPPPFEAVGGMNGLSQGVDDYLTLDLQPGEYVAICNIPDPGSGVAHSRLGMIRLFTVK